MNSLPVLYWPRSPSYNPLPVLPSSSALSLLAPLSHSAPPTLASPSSLDPPWASCSPAPPWCVDPLALPRTSKPVIPPRDADHSAQPWLPRPSDSVLVSCRSVTLQTSRSSAVPRLSTPSAPSGSASVHLGRSSLLLRLGLQIHQFRLSHWSPWFRLASPPWLLPPKTLTWACILVFLLEVTPWILPLLSPCWLLPPLWLLFLPGPHPPPKPPPAPLCWNYFF